MRAKEYSEFKKFFAKNYIKQYKEGNNLAKREIKNNIYKNINLTENQKDEFWLIVVRGGETNGIIL